ncbi:hypothetical protein B9K06_26305, partial [Bacillus sp. OG2]
VGDTAGIRESQDIIEQEGIKRAKKKSLESDINILILPADDLNTEKEFLSHAIELIRNTDKEYIVIINKSDLIISNDKDDILEKLSKQLNISKDR